ncbi:putative nucleotidyltransferase substrate binding domain-containing protein [Pseudoalteromonas sp. T1lg65]|uniref:putative nucleotidyltransferase substrate binding domain-containing protein n=1 Tax=Pseudoalteromonas sp. T1lg65 TaxID=2077101 RepID=UPI003F790BC3
MEIEHHEIANFLAAYPPFSDLPTDALARLAQQVEVSYYRAGTEILKYGEQITDLFVVRAGVVELYRRSGDLYNRISDGGIFGQRGLLMNRKVRFGALAQEDTLVYCIPVQLFDEYCDEYEAFADYFEADDNTRLKLTVSEHADSNDMTTAKVSTLLLREAVSVERNCTVQEAARVMSQEQVSSLLVYDPNKPVVEDPEEDDGQMVGLLSDKDFTQRVVADGLSFDTPVSEIMSTDLVLVDSNTYVFEAMMIMLRENVHHLPIVHKRRPIGVIALSDILRYESQSSLLFVLGIMEQQSVEDLAGYAQQLDNIFVRMVNEDANSHMIGSAMSVIGRTFKHRLLELAEEKFGPPPVSYCFIALGSMARDEQLIVTDQDNAMILSDDFQPTEHAEYFEQVAKFVCDGLANCGYKYCDGGIMASNSKWRMTFSQWQAQFELWIDMPNPEALLNSSIFFDLEGVWGNIKMAEQLSSVIAKKAKQSPRFLAAMAHNALRRTPPLGFFKGFVLEQDGEHNRGMNIKRRGTAPLSDLVRVHALAIGSRKQNTFERLDDIADANILPKGKVQDLKAAFEYIAMMRIGHQALQIEKGRKPDNKVSPEALSEFEQRNLKEAFQVLDRAQSFLKFRYQNKAITK